MTHFERVKQDSRTTHVMSLNALPRRAQVRQYAVNANALAVASGLPDNCVDADALIAGMRPGTMERLGLGPEACQALNPRLVAGQIEGSVYMGIAEALLEDHKVNRFGLHDGPSLLDYTMPTTLDTPEIEALIVESVDPEGPYGAKEAGEGPLHSSIPALSNAVHDAVGLRLTDLPFTPGKVLAALRERAEQTEEAIAT